MSAINKYITVKIAGRNYRISTSNEEEHIIQSACQQIDAKLQDLKHSYRAKDTQDYLAMTALTMAVEAQKRAIDINSLDAIEVELDKSNELLTNYLKNL